MGWEAYYHDGTYISEGTDGRPVQDGQDGKLALIVQDDFGHTIAVDLVHGVIIIDPDSIGFQNGTFEIDNPKTVLWVCDETNIGAELPDVQQITLPDKDGWYQNIILSVQWRPIWFTRVTNGVPTKVIGVQATLPEAFGGKNIKKMISLFIDGRIGID